MSKDIDMNLTCRQCGKEFVFSRAEQEFYDSKGFTLPGRCKECRTTKQNESCRLVCTQCGTKLEKNASIYCSTCLENIQFEFELKTKRVKSAANEAYRKLQAAESAKAELANLLRQKEERAAELELQLSNLSEDLEKAVQFHAALGWLEPALDEIGERLEALEHTQNRANERMLQLAQKIHETYANISLWETIKRILSRYQKQVT